MKTFNLNLTHIPFKYWGLSALAVMLVAYSLFQARFLVLGPHIEVTSNKDGDILRSRVITLEGRAANASWLALNGRQIFTDVTGRWSEKLIAPDGTSIMTISARDRFGRETTESIKLIYNPS